MYWKIRNFLQAHLTYFLGNPGLLTPKYDPRDKESEMGLGAARYEPKHAQMSHFRYQFTQNDNICTAAGAALAMSEQMSVRWSIKPIMRKMVKNGAVSGNGFSYQRAPLSVIVKDGLIPQDLMDDSNPSGQWGKYSKWDKKTEELYRDVAPLYKMTSYKKLRNEAAVLEALDKGFCVITASKWYTGMNRPQGPNFFLRMNGGMVGGHQYRAVGYRKNGNDFHTPQTFGASYGEKGGAWSETIFGNGYYDNWIVEFNGSPLLPMDVLLPVFLRQHEGLLVKAHAHSGDPKCYVIQDGMKHHVSGEDEMRTFLHLQETIGLVHVNKTVLDAVPEGAAYPLTK